MNVSNVHIQTVRLIIIFVILTHLKYFAHLISNASKVRRWLVKQENCG
jgi:hypothetical protein